MEQKILYRPEFTAIKQTHEPTPLKDLLTTSDKAYIAQRNLFFLTVKIHGKTFYATQEQRIPFDSVIMRDRAENIIGLPVGMGG